MNFTLHHFRKEVLNIRLRWALWLVLLGIDLAIQLEWLMPMGRSKAGSGHDGTHLLVMMVAVAVALAGCTEDQPARSNGFIATRPLPRTSYYLARTLFIVVMLVVPLILQEALYLTLSHRPWQEVAQGAGWRCLVAGAWLAWVMPGTAVWKGWRQTLLGACAFLGGLWLCEKAAGNWFMTAKAVRAAASFSEAGYVLAAWLGSFMMLGMAWLHQRGEWPLARRLLVASAVSPVLYLALIGFEAGSKDRSAASPGRVQELAKDLGLTVPKEHLRPLLNVSYQKRPAVAFYGHVESAPLPPQIEMIPRVTRVQASQAGRLLPAHLSQDDTEVPLAQWGPQFDPRPIAHVLPPGTLLVPPQPKIYSYGSDPLEYELGRVETGPADLGPEPLQLQCDFECDWYEWKTVADIAFKPGSRASSDEADLIITRVLADTEGKIQFKVGSRPGAVSMEFRTLQRNRESTPRLVLYAPDARIAWPLGDDFYKRASRAADTHWQRSLCLQDATHVLSYADGAQACDITKLRLIVLQRHYLGRSECTWGSPSIDMGMHAPAHSQWSFQHGFVAPDQAVKALEQRLDSLAIPPLESSREDLNRYLLDVLTAFQAMKRNSVQREQHDLVVAKLRPFATQHLDLLLALPPSAVPDENSPIITLVTELSTAAQRDFVVEHIMDCHWLTVVTLAKGWGDYARQKMLPAILARGRLKQHLRKLVLTWDDPALAQSQLRELPFFPDARTFEKLYLTPSLRPELDRLAATLWLNTVPVLGWEETCSDALEIALSQGNAAALDVALRWSARAGENASGTEEQQARKLALASARQTGLKTPKAGDPSLFTQFRNVQSAQFEYQPERRAWRKRL